MADPLPREKNPSKVCRYFLKGFCGYGEKCLNRHIVQKRRPYSPIDPSGVWTCRFYKRASCKFASKCWFKHIGPNGKVYPRPEPLNEFIVVGPVSEEPQQKENTSTPVEDSAASEETQQTENTSTPDEDSAASEETQQTENTPTPVEDSAASATIPAPKENIRRHFKRPQNQNIVPKNCFYYEKEGTCYYGNKCWYSHIESRVHLSDEPLHEANPEQEPDHTLLCYNFIFEECQLGDECTYVHGDICQLCDLAFLHPFDEQERAKHLQDCETSFEEDMDAAFKFMVSRDKLCSICLDYVWDPDKLFGKTKFGILDSCNHVFCLDCIRKWRFEKIRRHLNCPMCRRECSILIPSPYWFESGEEKKKWIDDYKAVAKEKPCRFYKKGKCLDGDKCLYKHPQPEPSLIVPDLEQPPGDTWENLESNNPLSVEQESNWRDIERDNELPLGEQDGTGNLAEENATIIDRRQNFQFSDIWDDTPAENPTSEDLVLQPGEQVNPSDLVADHQVVGSLGHVSTVDEQNVERQVQQDPDNSEDTLSKDPSSEDLLLQSSEQISPSDLAEEIIENQFDNSSGQVNVASIDDQQDVERGAVQQDPAASFDTPSRDQL